LQEPNLGKTNHRVIRSISLVDLFSPSLSDSISFLTLTRLVVVLKVYKFQICLFTPLYATFSDKEPPQHGRTHKLEVFWAAPSRRRNDVEKPSPPAWYKPSKVSSEDLAEQCRSLAPRRKLKGQPCRCHPAKLSRVVTFCHPLTHQPTSPNP
jgi:hypothetical protein